MGHVLWTASHPSTEDRVELEENDRGEGGQDDEFQDLQGDTEDFSHKRPALYRGNRGARQPPGVAARQIAC